MRIQIKDRMFETKSGKHWICYIHPNPVSLWLPDWQPAAGPSRGRTSDGWTPASGTSDLGPQNPEIGNGGTPPASCQQAASRQPAGTVRNAILVNVIYAGLSAADFSMRCNRRGEEQARQLTEHLRNIVDCTVKSRSEHIPSHSPPKTLTYYSTQP